MNFTVKRRQEPVVATQPRPPLHPAAQEAAAVYSEALERVEKLQQDILLVRQASDEEIASLKADLAVERRHVADLQVAVDFERRLKEQYQRYAVAVRTHLEHVASAAIKANDLAMQISEEPAPASATEADHGDEEAVSRELAAQSSGGHQ